MKIKYWIPILLAVFIFSFMGCKTTAAATTAAAETTAAAVETTTAAVAKLSTHSNSWYFANITGYSYTLTVNIWDPILEAKSGVSHPADAKDMLGSACNFDSTTDLAIPAQLIVEATTENFDTKDINVQLLFVTDSSADPYSGTGVPPTGSDNRISVEQFFSDGTNCSDYSSTNIWGYGQPSPFGANWLNPFAPGEKGRLIFFIIIHNYFSPAMPEGDPALLDFITLRPMYNSPSQPELGKTYFTDTDSRNNDGIYSYVGITLSGNVASPLSAEKSTTTVQKTVIPDNPDFIIDKNNVITKYKGDGGDVVIPEGVTRIGEDVFYNCTSLTSVTIPDSVTSIGDSAFSDCTSLTSITIPDSVTTFEGSVFNGCTGLTSVTIPDSLTEIKGYLFYNCTSLTSITIPDSVTDIGQNAFTGCTSLASVAIPDGVKIIGYGGSTFSGCTSLTSVTIPDSVTDIWQYAFADCTSLTSITIPNSVTNINERAFSGCTSLTISCYDNLYIINYAKENNIPYTILK